MREAGFLSAAKTYFWDELAAAFLLDETLFTSSSSAHLAVEIAPGQNYGAVRILPAESAHASHPVRYLQNLDFERAFRLIGRAPATPAQPDRGSKPYQTKARVTGR